MIPTPLIAPAVARSAARAKAGQTGVRRPARGTARAAPARTRHTTDPAA